jgi:hypothetical protein
MGIRFNKRFKLAPGLHINFSAKRGFSVSAGIKGASLNVGADGGQRTTVSAPGTGLSYVTEHRPKVERRPSPWRFLLLLVVLAVIVGALLTR